MVISKEILPVIEKALGFELYNHQKQYLLDEGILQGGRATGKTVAYCIKLALSDGEPLDLKYPETFSDRSERHYSRGFFRAEFMRIRGLLQAHGFKVRSVILR